MPLHKEVLATSSQASCHKIFLCHYNIEIHVCTHNTMQIMSQPHFEKSVRMKLTLPKWGLGSPPGLPKFQSSIVGVRTPRIGAISISLESYWNVNVENGLAWAFGHLQHTLWQKERPGVKLADAPPSSLCDPKRVQRVGFAEMVRNLVPLPASNTKRVRGVVLEAPGLD
jgi:hypothetical protein